jgi:hypothetical protein
VHDLAAIDEPPESHAGIGHVPVAELRIAAAAGYRNAVEHGERKRFAHEAVIGMPMRAVDEPLSVTELVAILA